MASPQSKLDNLPVEIIQRIASLSQCESVLALVKVNWRLHEACYTTTVFKYLLRNSSSYGVSMLWDRTILESKSTSALARLALADFCALAWFASVVTDDKSWKGADPLSDIQQWSDGLFSTEVIKAPAPTAPDPTLRWAPPLAALNHPFITKAGHCQQLVDKFQGIRPFLFLDPLKINFCVTATMLHQCAAAFAQGTSRAPELREYLHRILVSAPTKWPEYLKGILESGYSSSRPPIDLIPSLLLDAHMVLGEIPLPSPARMPLWDLLGRPMPFSDEGFSGVSHLPVMTSRAFLESGEWVGYYSYEMDLRRMRWDPAMKRIKFRAVQCAGKCALAASGSDREGRFRLRGTVTESGEVEMKKLYRAGSIREVMWDWNGMMTPFGIVGTWGGEGQPHGHLWMWKREWSLD